MEIGSYRRWIEFDKGSSLCRARWVSFVKPKLERSQGRLQEGVELSSFFEALADRPGHS